MRNTLTMSDACTRILRGLLQEHMPQARQPFPIQRLFLHIPLAMAVLTSLTCHLAAQVQLNKPTPPPPLVLVGATIVDVTDWGHSANDLHDAVVYIREGRITAVGPRATLPIPKGSKVIDC